MKKLIELDAALDALGNIDCSDGVGISALKCDVVDDAVTTIKALPTVDAVPARHGHWVKWYEETYDSFGVAYAPHCKCSECGREYDPYDANHMNYCSNCGVKLDGKDFVVVR